MKKKETMESAWQMPSSPERDSFRLAYCSSPNAIRMSFTTANTSPSFASARASMKSMEDTASLRHSTGIPSTSNVMMSAIQTP